MKHLKLFWQLIRINFKKSLIYRANFAITILAMGLWVGVYIVFFEVLFMHVDSIAGWSRGEMFTILAFYYLAQSLSAIFFRDSFEKFGEKMRAGQLDQLITKPASLQLLTFFEHMRFDHVIDMGVTGLLFGYISLYTDVQLSWSLMALGLGATLISQILFYGLFLAMVSITFFADRMDSMHSFMWHLTQIARYPRQIYTGAAKIVLQFIFPIALTTTIPAEITLGRGSWELFGYFTLISVIVLLLANGVFQFGLKHYQSAN